MNSSPETLSMSSVGEPSAQTNDTPTPTPPVAPNLTSIAPTAAVLPCLPRPEAPDLKAIDATVHRTPRKSRAGRRPGAVWELFTPLRTDANKTHAQCNFCERRCAGVAARMTAHILNKCPAAPADAIEMLALAAREAPEKRRRVNEGDQFTGLAAFAGGADVEAGSARRINVDGTSVVSAPTRWLRSARQTSLPSVVLHKLVVACLRHDVGLDLLEDEFVHEALALPRPGFPSVPVGNAASALLDDVGEAVASEVVRWKRTSTSFTLLHRSANGKEAIRWEWEAADSERRRMLLAEASWNRPNNGGDDDVTTMIAAQLTAFASHAVSGVCCDSETVYEAARAMMNRAVNPLSATDEDLQRSEPVAPTTPILLSKCLVRETFRLWQVVVKAIPQVLSITRQVSKVLQPLIITPQQSADVHALLSAPTRRQGWALVTTLINGFEKLKLPDGREGGILSTLQHQVHDVKAVMAPFAWLFALSESKDTASSQVVLVWAWLASVVGGSPLVDVECKDQVRKNLFQVLASAVEDHHLAALLLDPRVQGVGLSVTGRRKVKAMVVQVAERMWSKDPKIGLATARQALLVQLGHYMAKSDYFSDVVAWEMSRGNPPETFWKDYAQDAPELTQVALAVLTFVPYVRSANAYSVSPQAPAHEQPFEIRQITFHHVANHKNSNLGMAAVLAKHSALLSTAVDFVEPADSLTVVSSSPVSPAYSIVDRVAEALDGMARVADELAPAEGANTTVEGPRTRVDFSWFETNDAATRAEIEAALRFCVPPTLVRAASTAVAM